MDRKSTWLQRLLDLRRPGRSADTSDEVASELNNSSVQRASSPSSFAQSAHTRKALHLIDWANSLNNRGQHRKALSACEQALRLDSTLAAAYTNKGVALNGLGRRQEALVAYEHALQLDPTDPMNYTNKASVLHLLGRKRVSFA